jgi:hypothetical protein
MLNSVYIDVYTDQQQQQQQHHAAHLNSKSEQLDQYTYSTYSNQNNQKQCPEPRISTYQKRFSLPDFISSSDMSKKFESAALNAKKSKKGTWLKSLFIRKRNEKHV